MTRFDDFDEWMKKESEKEKNQECRRRIDCDECIYEDDCQYKALLNGLDEW